MNIKDIILIIIVTVTVMLSVKRESDFEKYEKIKIKNVPSIKPEDLPKEFSKKAYEIIDEFIRKTFECNKEILIYFDYRSGEVVDCIIGEFDNVSRNFLMVKWLEGIYVLFITIQRMFFHHPLAKILEF